jgi:hypothetical protein
MIGESFAHLRDVEIILAVRHHQKALIGLKGYMTERLSVTVRQKLVNDITAGLLLLEAELNRRNLHDALILEDRVESTYDAYAQQNSLHRGLP